MDILFFWIAVTLYASSAVIYVASLIFKREQWFRAAPWFALVGLVPHSASILVRWAAVGHGPYINRYEVFSSDTWVAVVLFLLIQWRYRAARYAGPVVMTGAFLLMGFALLSTREPVPLPPSLESYWLVVHVAFAKLSLGSYLVATGLAVIYLFKERPRENPSSFWSKVPNPELLDDLSYRFVALGFVFTGVMIVAGSIWGNKAWGRYWGWDPVEIWSLVIWLVYGIYLHLRITYRWKGRRASISAIICFIIALLAFFVMPILTKSIHSEYLVK